MNTEEDRFCVLQLVSNRVWGGGERYAYDLMRRTLSEGIPTAVVAAPAPVVADRFRELGVQVTTAPLRGFTDAASPRIVRDAVLRAPGDSPVVIHVHDFKNAFTAILAKKMVGRRRKVRVVMTRHLVKRGKRNALYRYIYRNLDAMIFISGLVRDEFFSGRPQMDAARCHTVLNSILDAEMFPHAFSGEGSVRMAYLGRLSPEKGLELLLRSLSKLKDRRWTLAVAGKGEDAYEEGLRKLAADLGISDRVEWLGYVDNVHPLLMRTDIGVVPSVWREPFGLVLLEYMAQGIPVVTTGLGAQREILEEGVDSIIVGGDTEEELEQGFAAALARLIDDAGLRSGMGRKARETFEEKFSYDRFFSGIIDAYRSALHRD